MSSPSSQFEILFKDLKHGARILAKTPGLTLIAIFTLAFGIGACTAVFSVVNAALLKPLPYPDSANVVMLWRVWPIDAGFSNTELPWSPREFRIASRDSKAFQHLGAFKSDAFNLTGLGEPVRLDGIRATSGFFPALGIAPALGRVFSVEEDQPGREHVVVVSHALWRERFGGDPNVVGRFVQLNGSSYRVLGVMPAGFAFPRAEEMPAVLDLPREAQLWVPAALVDGLRAPSEYGVVARLASGGTLSQAIAEMQVIDSHIIREMPGAKGSYTHTIPIAQQVVGDTHRPLLLMLAAVGVVLLIACSNVASLLLARSVGRAREFALRAALGAGKSRLVRQLLTESVVLALFGGLSGVGLAMAGIHFGKLFGPVEISRLSETSLDLPVLAFAMSITLGCGFLFGLAPALGAARAHLASALREGGQKGGSARAPRVRNGLLVGEVALAMVLVISAGLLLRTYARMLSSDRGFQTARVLTFQFSLESLKYREVDQMTQLYHRALEQLRSLPGVQSAGLVAAVPLGGGTDSTVIRIPGHETTDERRRPYANYTFASPGYFATVGTPLLRGRDFLETDTLQSRPVTVISKEMARKFWPGEDPIGKQVGVGDARWPVRTIVGIVADVKRRSLRDEPAPEMYVPYTQNEIKIWPAMQNLQAAVRTSADPASMTQGVRAAIHSIDPDLPVSKIASLETLLDNSMRQPRFSVLLLGSFAWLAMLLACIGMYGVVSYGVAQRTREIGVRMALGAERREVFGMVLIQGLRLAGLGVIIGLLSAAMVTRLMTRFLYGIQPTDLLTFVSVSLLVMVVTLVASYVPARRATLVDPVVALRYE